MKNISGYIILALLIPLFFYILFSTSSEFEKVEALHSGLEEAVNVDNIALDKTSLLLDQNGNVFSEVNRPFRLYVHDENIPQFVKDVIVMSEDQHFYDHVGFDAGAIMRALVKNLVFTHIQQGGSTITQQLARNLYLGQEKTYNRKLTELFYAFEIEQNLSKDEVLELYLNVIYFSNGVYGIDTASQYYFQKNVGDLNKAELAFLASIPNNPRKYDPIDHFDETKIRQERLLDILQQNGKLTEEEALEIKKTPINLNLRQRIDSYPDYAVYVENELEELIAVQEGYKLQLETATTPEEKEAIVQTLQERVADVLKSGIKIHTGLNPAMQQKTVNALNKNLPYQDIQAATVTIDNATRRIVAISGGKDYQKYNFHRAYQAIRQPGSTIKPILVYAPYIETYQPSIYETVNANHYCIGNYCPQNYGGYQPGNVTMNEAFKESYNIPAVRYLEKLGVTPAFTFLNEFSFSRVTENDHNYAAAVGGFTYGMSPLELTDAFTSFVDGTYTPARAIVKVTDGKGNTLYDWKDQPKTIWSGSTVEKIRAMMNATARNGTGAPAYVNTPYVGIKTGTTNEYSDYWVMGLTNTYTTGVWVGYDIPQNMKSIEQNRPSHLIWRDIMK